MKSYSPTDSSAVCLKAPFVKRLEGTRDDPPCGHILVLDDELCIREIAQRVLESAGYSVECADDGEAGRELLRKQAFDVLVTDHCMPRLSGLDLLRWLRQEHNRIPVLFISGYIPWDEPDFRDCLFPGAILQKPFSCGTFLDAVKSVWALAAECECTPCNESIATVQAHATSLGVNS